MPRPRKIAKSADMFRVARLFHKEGMTKGEIAAAMHISIPNVTWHLSEARKRGVVKIQLFETLENKLEERIREKHKHVRRVLIAPGPQVETEAQCDELFRRFGSLAADYFVELYETHPVHKSLHVGLTGGARVLEFALAVPVMNRESVHIHVTALVGRGRLAYKTNHVEPTVTASILWTHCGSIPGHCEYETVEPYRIDKEPGPDARRALDDELARLEQIASIEAVIQNMDQLDVVFAGIGFADTPSASGEMKNRITMGSLLEAVVTPGQIAAEGSVGDICYCPYRANGTQDDRWRFFLTAGHYSEHRGADFYRHMVATGKTVVGFGGPHLLPAIKAALKGKLVNVLILDEHTARQIAEGD